MFDAGKTRMIGLLYGEKTDNVKTFSSDIGTLWADGRTDERTDGQNCYNNSARQCVKIHRT